MGLKGCCKFVGRWRGKSILYKQTAAQLGKQWKYWKQQLFSLTVYWPTFLELYQLFFSDAEINLFKQYALMLEHVHEHFRGSSQISSDVSFNLFHRQIYNIILGMKANKSMFLSLRKSRWVCWSGTLFGRDVRWNSTFP